MFYEVGHASVFCIYVYNCYLFLSNCFLNQYIIWLTIVLCLCLKIQLLLLIWQGGDEVNLVHHLLLWEWITVLLMLQNVTSVLFYRENPLIVTVMKPWQYQANQQIRYLHIIQRNNVPLLTIELKSSIIV